MTTSKASETAVLGQLKHVFPNHSSSLLRNAATQHNFDLELTVASLLAADTDDTKPLQVPQLQQPRDWLRKSKPKGRSGGWHSLTKQHQPGSPAVTAVSFQPQHSVQHARPLEHNSGEFPSLGGSSSGGKVSDGAPRSADGCMSAGPSRTGNGVQDRQRPHRPAADRHRSRPPSAASTSEDKSDGDDVMAVSKDFARVLGKSASAKREEEAGEQQQRRHDAAAELTSRHPWAGHDLVQAVLARLGGEQQAAAQVLDEMLAARLTQQRRSSDGLARRSGEGGAAPQEHAPDTALANACPVDSPEDNELAADLAEEPYRHHRGEAIRLTHVWQRGMRRAAAAFAASDKAAAGRIAQAARVKREEALAAHEAAAKHILHDNNAARGRGAAELDLHGLHASEAVAALDAHLQGLEADSAPSSTTVERVRVIVGRGRHSAGGEATLPRAVESYLMDVGRKYTARGGAFEVPLRRGRRPGSATTR